MSYPMYQDIRDHNQVFSGMFCRKSLPLSINAEGKTERIQGELVSGNFFNVLGIGAALGRVFTASDDLHENSHPFIVISYDYWQDRFGGKPDVLGKKLVVDGTPMTIIGVSQKGFLSVDPGESPQVRVPIMMQPAVFPWHWYKLWNRRGHWVNAFGRMKPGVTIEQAKAALQPFYHQQLEMETREAAFSKASTYDRQQFLRGLAGCAARIERTRRTAQANGETAAGADGSSGAGAVDRLCERGQSSHRTSRRHGRKRWQFGCRWAASRGQVVSQLITESLLLAMCGGAAGIALAIWLDHLLVAFIPSGDIHRCSYPLLRIGTSFCSPASSPS